MGGVPRGVVESWLGLVPEGEAGTNVLPPDWSMVRVVFKFDWLVGRGGLRPDWPATRVGRVVVGPDW